MKKIILPIFLILLIGNVIALTDLGCFEQGEKVRITQVCNDATYINISSVSYPNSLTSLTNIGMIPNGNGEYYYNFTDTNTLGRYDVRGVSDGCEETFSTYFEITTNGKCGTNANILLFVILFILIYGLTFLCFFIFRNAPLTILMGMIMIAFGIYTVNEGIIIYRDWMTNYLSYITIGIGTTISLWAFFDWIQDLM